MREPIIISLPCPKYHIVDFEVQYVVGISIINICNYN